MNVMTRYDVGGILAVWLLFLLGERNEEDNEWYDIEMENFELMVSGAGLMLDTIAVSYPNPHLLSLFHFFLGYSWEGESRCTGLVSFSLSLARVSLGIKQMRRRI